MSTLAETVGARLLKAGRVLDGLKLEPRLDLEPFQLSELLQDVLLKFQLLANESARKFLLVLLGINNHELSNVH